MRRYLDTEIFHLKDRSDDGILGRSRLSRAAEVLGNALALQDYSGQMWKNAAVPSGVLSTEGKLGAEVFERLKSAFENRFTGTKNAGRVMILENGMKWNTISMSPEDAEVLASRRFSVEEICRLFQVPPPIIQDLSHGTFTNSREAGRWFAQFSLSPWARKIEAEFSRSVFSGETRKSHHIEIDLSGLTRGDTEARWASHKIAVDSGILDPDEVRELEGFNPRKKDAVNV
jgi:HK97 family phage portal protein